jgi:hypothetical protein
MKTIVLNPEIHNPMEIQTFTFECIVCDKWVITNAEVTADNTICKSCKNKGWFAIGGKWATSWVWVARARRDPL